MRRTVANWQCKDGRKWCLGRATDVLEASGGSKTEAIVEAGWAPSEPGKDRPELVRSLAVLADSNQGELKHQIRHERSKPLATHYTKRNHQPFHAVPWNSAPAKSGWINTYGAVSLC